MSYDALFQLGMGSVGLAPQKEELFARRASTACAGVFRPAPVRLGLMRRRAAAEPACAFPRAQGRRRPGAKARAILPL